MTVQSQLLQTFLCLPVSGGPSAAADIQRSSDRVPDSPSWLVEAARRGTEKDGGQEREEPAEPREGEAGGISGIDESSAPGSRGQEGAGPQRAGSGQTSGAVSGSARVCVCTTCVCVRARASPNSVAHDTSPSRPHRPSVCRPCQNVTEGRRCSGTRADLLLDVLKLRFPEPGWKDARPPSPQRSSPSLWETVSSRICIISCLSLVRWL